MKLDLCTRCGRCLSSCPTYQVYLSELYSPRGRISLLSEGLFYRSFEDCTWCEVCARVCPHGLSFPIIYFEALLRGEVRGFEVHLPSFLTKNPLFFYERFKKGDEFQGFITELKERGEVTIFLSCDVRSVYPKALKNLLEFFKKRGIRAWAPVFEECCGIAYLVTKDFDGLREHALKLVRAFSTDESPVLVFCATCWWMFKKIYPLILSENQEVKNFARRVISAYAFLEREFPDKLKFFTEKVLFHLPCHLTDERKVFKFRLKVEEFCCGSPRLSLLKMGFQEDYQKFWKKKLENKDFLATFCIGCYFSFKLQLKAPPKVVHWLELLC